MNIDYSVPYQSSIGARPGSSLRAIGLVVLGILGFITFVLACYAVNETRMISNSMATTPSISLNAPQRVSGRQAVSMYRGFGSWHDQKPLPYASSDSQAVRGPDGLIFLFGGVDDNEVTPVTLNTIMSYDVVRQTYKNHTNLVSPRAQFGAAGLTDAVTGEVNKFVIAGGVSDTANGTPLTSTEIYTVSSTGVSLSTGVGSLNEQHLDGCMASTGDAAYMIGGWKNNYADHSSTVEKLTRTGTTWEKVADLPEARGDCAAVGLNGKVYVVGGYYSPSYNASEGFKNTLFVYDPASNTWSQKASMFHPRGDLQLVALDETILAIGGETYFSRNGGHADKIASHYVEEYFPEHDKWETRALLGNGRFRFAAAVSHGGVHVFGGSEVCAEPASNQDYTSCYGSQIASQEVYFELRHPDLWVNFDSAHEF